MKRIVCLCLSFLLFVGMIPISAIAAENECEIIYLDDGSYLTISVQSTSIRASGTKTGSKTYQYTDSNGDFAWKAVLTGTFSYNGTSASCTSSSSDVTIFNSGWYLFSKTAGKTGATATGDVTMGLKMLGITTKKVPINMSLSCDANGNLS